MAASDRTGARTCASRTIAPWKIRTNPAEHRTPTGFHGAELADVQFGDTVLVVGIGPVGLMAVAGAALRGAARILAVGPRPVCVEAARKYGATDFISYKNGPIDEQVLALTGGKGVDCAIIAGGDVDTFIPVVKILKPGGRIGNVKLSAQIINGLVLNSGETFSYNGSVGKRTADRGFKPAPAYVKGETVDEIGGGICQTSSTLYLACLMSNLEITERYAHRYVPAYIAWGMDATVSWGGPDYKFTNNTLDPVKIVTKYEKGYLTVQILGTNVDGTYVKMSNEVLSKTPWETIYQEDPTMAPGSPDVVKVTPYTGYKVNSYQTIYDKDGKVIDSHFEASSNYKVRNKVILQAPAAQPGSGTAEIPAVTPDTPSDTPVPMEPTVPAEPAASPDLPVEPEIPAEP